MIRPLLLVLLLASPALADPLPLLPGSTWDIFQSTTRVALFTSEFFARGNNDGDSGGTYQGIGYCQSDGFDCTTHQGPQPISVSYTLIAPIPPGCIPFMNGTDIGDCASGTYPVELVGVVGFRTPDGQVIATFQYDGLGTGVNVHNVGIRHADFGSAAVPEPATWLLLLTGIVILMARSASWSRTRV